MYSTHLTAEGEPTGHLYKLGSPGCLEHLTHLPRVRLLPSTEPEYWLLRQIVSNAIVSASKEHWGSTILHCITGDRETGPLEVGSISIEMDPFGEYEPNANTDTLGVFRGVVTVHVVDPAERPFGLLNPDEPAHPIRLWVQPCRQPGDMAPPVGFSVWWSVGEVPGRWPATVAALPMTPAPLLLAAEVATWEQYELARRDREARGSVLDEDEAGKPDLDVVAAEWIASHHDAYTWMVERTRLYVDTGNVPVRINDLFEDWRATLDSSDGRRHHALNNNLRPYIARSIMTAYPELAGAYQIRQGRVAKGAGAF